VSERAGAGEPVVIIGAGIVGVSAAIWLQREGRQVVLVDRAGPGEGTSYGNGGVLASCSIVPVTVPGLVRKAPSMLLDRNQPLFLKWSYLPKLAPWLVRYLRHCAPDEAKRIASALLPIVGDSLADHQVLAAGTGAEKWIVPSDYVFVYRDRAHFEQDRFGWSLRRAHGFVWEELEGPAFKDYEPAFSERLGFGARVPGHGIIADPGRYVKDLAADAERNGARIVKAEVEDFVRDDGKIVGVRAGGATLPCSAAIVATGAWSKPLAKRLGLKVPLESERGYHIDLYGPSLMPRSPAMIAAGKFVATPMEGRLRLAGILEFGGLRAPPSRPPLELLLRQIRAAMPGLTWQDAKEWMGHRPAITDSLPLIGEVPGLRGAYLGFGHHHIGLTGGPKTGRLLAQLICGRRPNIDLAPYAPSRFL
jgi:D-amino-acid dehydrogenase